MSLKRFDLKLKYGQLYNPNRTQSFSCIPSKQVNDSEKFSSYQSAKELLEDDVVRGDVRQRSLIHRYYPSEFKPTYTPEYIRRLTRAATARAEQNLIRGRVALQLQSPLIAAKTINHEQIKKNLHPERKQLQIDDDELKKIAEREYFVYKNRKERAIDYTNKIKSNRRYNTSTTSSAVKTQNDDSDHMKHLIRGRSPTTIASALLAKTETNLNSAAIEEKTFIRQTMQSLRLHYSNRQNFNKEPYIPMYRLKLRKQ